MQSHERRIPFVEIRSSLFVLERIACSVKHNEPVLLVGETGTGKTTLVQNLALRLGQKLTVLVCYKLLYYVLCYLKFQGFLSVRHDVVYIFFPRT